MRTIRLKIEEKAHDLFQEKSGQALFSVTRILRCQENGKFFEKDRKLLNLSHIKMLRNVRKLLEGDPLSPLLSICETSYLDVL
jgi:hypothetical protein